MTTFCYLFEAHSIQTWIFAGGRLRDAVGASRLLDGLCSWAGNDIYGEVLAAAGLSSAPEVARRAGGGLCVYHGDRAELARLRAIFALKVRAAVPDLPFVDAIGEGDDMPASFKAARRKLDAARAVPSPDPLRAGPFVLATPRTGAPAIRREKPEQGGEFLDAGLDAKRKGRAKVRAAIEEAFDPNGKADFPVELSKEDGRHRSHPAFPFLGENRYIGLLHADGNGMGKVLMDLGRALETTQAPGYAEGFRLFSEALAEATGEAARAAMTVLEPSRNGVWPIRPLILGGDDLSAIVRGDYAIPFAEAFLKAFETETAKEFDKLRQGKTGDFWKRHLPPRLSAGAGIAFVKANQPFDRAYVLAEDLAKTAKTTAKAWLLGGDDSPPPATIAFHRIATATIPARWSEAEKELSGGTDDRPRQMTMNPYVVSTESAMAAKDAPRIERLDHLCRTLVDRDVARGPARALTPDFLHTEPDRDWNRMLVMARKRDPASASRFLEAMAALGCPDGPFDAQGRTPVLDALGWIAVAQVREEEEETDVRA